MAPAALGPTPEEMMMLAQALRAGHGYRPQPGPQPRDPKADLARQMALAQYLMAHTGVNP